MNKHLAPSKAYCEDSNRGSGGAIGLAHEEEQQPNQGLCEEENLFESQTKDIESELEEIRKSIVHHFFMEIDASNPDIAEEAANLDPAVFNPKSITHFLSLPTITARANLRRWVTDPIVDFTKFIMFTSDWYPNTFEQVERQNEANVKEKERRI